MRKFVLFLSNLLLLCLMINAQNPQPEKKKTSIGIKTGVNITRFKLDGKIAGVQNADYRTGFVAGTFVNFPLHKSPFSVQPEFLYSSMGADIRNELNEKQNIRLNYFSVPLLLKYQITKKLQFFAGPQVDAIIYGKETNKFGDFDVTKTAEEFDAYATWGMEWWPWKNIVLQGRYMHGFKKVYPVAPLVSTNNRGFQITLGLRFHKPPPLPAPKKVEVPMTVVDKDTDGDGIFDSKDKCPTVPGVAKYEGCPVPDTDKDGIFDDKDKCPEMAGYPELDGCPYPDRDKDGVTDNKDRCPDEPGSTKNDGCPITDRDGDGVPDASDRCPDTPGPASNQGCPLVNESVITKTAAIARNIYFETNSTKLQTVSYGPLSELIQILNDNPSYKLSIEGHTDNTGTNAYNQTLSDGRAGTVKKYLIDKGIKASRLSSTGFGEEKPVANNETKEGRAINRRVELKLSN